ncbi:P-type ATPase [Cellulosimicrobium cellulans]|uniref:P-type ATPase A domain-containing protein n=1 Tax=Cellulosimicrobium cellulans TaxID=1710 RepID=A0A4Y4DSX5_CELCE|nr:hypothetical protein [Cellulosimicrobium cellulans]GED08462.1 hypothetical protein CCE02nite_04610 [Cellulosimicrobium cellulans]
MVGPSRYGRQELVPAEELVPGDVVRLEAGSTIPADERLQRIVGTVDLDGRRWGVRALVLRQVDRHRGAPYVPAEVSSAQVRAAAQGTTPSSRPRRTASRRELTPSLR